MSTITDYRREFKTPTFLSKNDHPPPPSPPLCPSVCMPSICYFFPMYMTLSVCPHVRMSPPSVYLLHIYPPCVWPFYEYVPTVCISPLHFISVYFPSMCMPLPCVCLLRVCPSICMSPSCMCPFVGMPLPCVCHSVCAYLRLYVPLCVYPLRKGSNNAAFGWK